MSVQASKWAAGTGAGDPTAKAVLMVLAEAADETGATFLGQDAIAQRCDTRRETVNRAMRRLEDRGFITRTQRRRGDGYRSSDLIQLAICDVKSREHKSHENRSHVTKEPISCDANRTAEPSVNRQIKDITSEGPSESKPKTRKQTPSDPAFESLWLAYPHFRGRTTKADSYHEWSKLSSADRAAIVGAVCEFANTDQAKKDGHQWVKGFHLWIGKGLWRDFVMPAEAAQESVQPDWAARLNRYAKDGTWPSTWGEKPGKPGCQVPVEFLDKHSGAGPVLRIVGGDFE